jgi:hypothetical protein
VGGTVVFVCRVQERCGKRFARTARQLISGTCSASNGEGGLLLVAAMVLPGWNIAEMASSITLDVPARGILLLEVPA